MATAIITLPEVNAAKPQNSDRCPDLINSYTQIEVNHLGSKSMSPAWQALSVKRARDHKKARENQRFSI